MTRRRIDISFRILIAVSLGGAALVLAAANGFEWIVPAVFIIMGIAATAAGIVSLAKLLHLWGRLRFHFTLFHAMLLVTWVAIFFAAERHLLSSAGARKLRLIPLVEQFLLAIFAFYVGVLAPLAWREHVRRKAAEAARLKASESPFQIEGAQGPEDTVEDDVSAIDACPVCRAAIKSLGESANAWTTTTSGNSGNFRKATCSACGSRLRGVYFDQGPTAESSDEAAPSCGIIWEARVKRKALPAEIRMQADEG